MADSAGQKAQAITTHSDQSAEFMASYETLARDPYRDCFAYSRRRLEVALNRYLPEGGEGRRVLDVGCGTGHHMAALRSRGFVVAGVDGSDSMLVHARRLNPDSEIKQSDVERLPFEDGAFDYTLCVEVLRYLPSPDPCLREMRRVLKPGGVCLVTAAPLFNSNGYVIVNRVAPFIPIRSLVRLRQFFITSSGLRQAMTRAGFHEIQVTGVYTGPINWIERLLPQALPRTLRLWEPLDARLADKPGLREFANMFLARAAAAPSGPLA